MVRLFIDTSMPPQVLVSVSQVGWVAHTVFDKMILSKGLETAGTSEALGHQVSNCHSEFLLLGRCPTIAVLQQAG